MKKTSTTRTTSKTGKYTHLAFNSTPALSKKVVKLAKKNNTSVANFLRMTITKAIKS